MRNKPAGNRDFKARLKSKGDKKKNANHLIISN